MTYKIGSTDVTSSLVSKSYFFDLYPSLTNVIASPALWVWGRGASGDLGDNTTTNRSSPVQTAAGGTNWVQIACGNGNMAAIKSDGTLWTWGSNSSAQLGDSTIISKSSPIQTVTGGTLWKQVTSGQYHVSAISNGSIWSWGSNAFGQLGTNNTTDRSSPVQIVTGGSNWIQVASCGSSRHVAAIKTDGTLWLWGSGVSGSLGNNTTVDKSSPVQTIAGGTDWKQVAVGSGHTAAIKVDGTLWMWGNNTLGQLGIGSTSNISSPVQTVAGGTTWKQVSAGTSHTAAIKTDGTLWTWGQGAYSQLGDNTTVDKSSPVQTVTGGTNWKSVSAGHQHNAGLKSDGTLWVWGYNVNGQLGDNTRTNRSSPVQTITGGTNWKQVSCGVTGTLAIAEDNPFL